MMTFDEFQVQASRVLGLDLGSYKSKRVERRVESLMRRKGLVDFSACLQQLRMDSQFRADFLNHFTINTSEFFRNPTNFVTIEKEIFPKLFAHSNRVKIWSAPCSNGCEPYSLAIILDEMGIRPNQYELLGIDIDPDILDAARLGVYNMGALKNVNQTRMQRYFTKTGSDHFALHEQIKKMVTLKHFDLLKDPFQKNWDMILCRNLFIYFTQDVKDLLTQKFSDSLRPGGILFLGNTEFIFDPERYGLRKLVSSFYERM